MFSLLFHDTTYFYGYISHKYIVIYPKQCRNKHTIIAHDCETKCYSHSQGTTVGSMWKILFARFPVSSAWCVRSRKHSRANLPCTATEPTGSVAVYGQGNTSNKISKKLNHILLFFWVFSIPRHAKKISNMVSARSAHGVRTASWKPSVVNLAITKAHEPGFFSKFLMGGGTQNFRSPSGTKSDGGGLAKKIWLKPKLPT